MDINKLLNYKPIHIAENTRFWMVRTKKGYFYDEFIKKKFVALGWNEIDVSNYSGDEKALKEHIQEVYGDKVPGSALNKCKSFIAGIKEGDILVIPSEGSRRITFAKAGSYYEVENCNTEQEKDVIYKIDNKQLLVNSIECPYKKRRHIEILSTISGGQINYHLLSAITSYHGICNLDGYGELILDCIYDIYEYKNNIGLSINVTKKDAIRPREITNLMYGLTEYLCTIIDEDALETTINLNSPGKIMVRLKNVASSLKSHCWCFLGILVVITGGSVKDAELPGIVKVIQDFKTMNVYIQKEEADLESIRLSNELMEVEIQGKKLENAASILEIIEKAEENNIDVDKLLQQSDLLLEVNESLELKSNENLVNEQVSSTEENE